MKKLATFLVLLSLGMFSFGCTQSEEDVTTTPPDTKSMDDGAGNGAADDGAADDGAADDGAADDGAADDAPAEDDG